MKRLATGLDGVSLPKRTHASVLVVARHGLPPSTAHFLRTANHPIVGVWNGGVSSRLRQRQNVNLAAPTRLCRIMTRYGSDKGCRSHNYTTIYSALFTGIRNHTLRVFELGLGTNDPHVPSSMGAHARPGASLRGWREFFPRALVYGAAIDRGILFEEDRIKTFHCYQCDDSYIRSMWSEPELQDCGMDIIVEDGLHTFSANISFLDGSLDRVRAGGFYIIDDILSSDLNRWVDVSETVYAKRFPTYEFSLVALPNRLNWHDDNNLIVHRHS